MSKSPLTREILERLFLKEDLTSSEIGERFGRARSTVAKKLSKFKISKKNDDGTFKKGFKKRDKKGKNAERIIQHLGGEVIKVWKSQKSILETRTIKPQLHRWALYSSLNNLDQSTMRGFEWDYEPFFEKKYPEQYEPIKEELMFKSMTYAKALTYRRNRLFDRSMSGEQKEIYVSMMHGGLPKKMTKDEAVKYWTPKFTQMWRELGYK